MGAVPSTRCPKCGASMVWDNQEKTYLCLADGTRLGGLQTAEVLSSETKSAAEETAKPGTPMPAPRAQKAEPRKLEDLEPGVTQEGFFSALRKASQPVRKRKPKEQQFPAGPLDLRAAIASKLDQHAIVELDDLSNLLVKCLRRDPAGTLRSLGFFGKTFSANDVWDAAGVTLVDEILKRTPGAEEVSPGHWRWKG